MNAAHHPNFTNSSLQLVNFVHNSTENRRTKTFALAKRIQKHQTLTSCNQNKSEHFHSLHQKLLNKITSVGDN